MSTAAERVEETPPEPALTFTRPPRREVPPPKPDYDFLVAARRSRWYGWRFARNGFAGRPDSAATERYLRLFVERLGIDPPLQMGGIPADPLVLRNFRAYVEAVHGRIRWYERSLSWRAWSTRVVQGTLLVVGAGAAAFVFGLGEDGSAPLVADESALVQMVAAGITALATLGKFFANSGAKPEVEAWVAALSALKKSLFAFENEWDDKFVPELTDWPEGFVAALRLGVEEANEIEDAERQASLLGAMGAVGDAAAVLEGLQAPIAERGTARASARAAARARVLSPVEQARLNLEAAVAAEKRVDSEQWMSDDTRAEYRQKRLDAELELQRLQAEDRFLRT